MEHTIGYAYPSSIIARQLGRAASGCFYLETAAGLQPHDTFRDALAASLAIGSAPSWDSKDHPDNLRFLQAADKEAAELAELERRTAAAEAAGDADTLAAIWLHLQGLEWVDSIDELAADTTPAPVAAGLIRDRLAEIRAA